MLHLHAVMSLDKVWWGIDIQAPNHLARKMGREMVASR
jgi:hypothetical protein